MNEQRAAQFAHDWIEARQPGKKREDNCEEQDLLPDLLVVKQHAPLHTKRFKSTEGRVFIYSDETRDNRADYDEYCELWRDFVNILVCVRGRSIEREEEKVSAAEYRDARLKAIQSELQTETNADKRYQLRSEASELRIQINSSPKVDDLKAERDKIQSLMDDAKAVIKKLKDNTYVQGRNHNNKANLRDYEYALHAMLTEK